MYQTLADIAAEKNSTIVFPFPEEAISKKGGIKTEDLLENFNLELLSKAIPKTDNGE